MSLSHQKKMRTLRGFYVGICLWNDAQTKWFDFLSGFHVNHVRPHASRPSPIFIGDLLTSYDLVIIVSSFACYC
jgi:hypothetical protein